MEKVHFIRNGKNGKNEIQLTKQNGLKYSKNYKSSTLPRVYLPPGSLHLETVDEFPT